MEVAHVTECQPVTNCCDANTEQVSAVLSFSAMGTICTKVGRHMRQPSCYLSLQLGQETAANVLQCNSAYLADPWLKQPSLWGLGQAH